MRNLGTFIRQKREEKGLLLRQLAAQMDMDVAYLSKIERGERIIREEHLGVISQIFDVSKDDLVNLYVYDNFEDMVKMYDNCGNCVNVLQNLIEKYNLPQPAIKKL
jgi:HTH-type transcriptional regulator, competence development regulator